VGAALSIDNLVVGIALGTAGTSLVLAVVTIAVVSVMMSLIGLEVGGRIGVRFEMVAGELGALVLIAVGIVVMTGLL